MENVENFSCKSRFFLVLVLFWTFFVIFGLNTEFVPEISAGIAPNITQFIGVFPN
jgi:hypothetical protein